MDDEVGDKAVNGRAGVLTGCAKSEKVVSGFGDGGAEDLQFEVAVGGVEGDGHIGEGSWSEEVVMQSMSKWKVQVHRT